MSYRKSSGLFRVTIKLCICVPLIYGGMPGSLMASGYPPVFPGMGPYSYPNYSGYIGRYNYAPHYPSWPAFYPMGQYNPWRNAPGYSATGYRGPWGNMRGGITPDGSFWVNIHFGGNYSDLMAFFAFMQLSGGMHMNSGTRHNPAPVLTINENM